jgi:cell division protein FtsQ
MKKPQGQEGGERRRPVKIAAGSTRRVRGGTRAVTRGRAAGGRRLPWRRLARTFWRLLLCLVVGAALGVGAKAGWTWLTSSPRFAVSKLVIHAGPRVTEPEVRMLAAIAEGDNIFSFRLADCVRALELHPWVKRASVMRELPDRVTIEIVERKPRALAALGSLYYVDGEGEVFKKVLPGESADFPVFTGLTLREVVERQAGVEARLLSGLALVALAERSSFFPATELSEIRLDRTYGALAIRTGDGMRVRFGFGNFPDKWMRLERTLVEMGADIAKVAELDLNYESKVTVRLRAGYRVASAAAEDPG